uniref:[histone H3]-trimethyl-L-lysine(4) demethylase n=1 Tax=Schistocephalus solidus TaxID=70667 RepID=A0A0X3NGY2_SCHSO
MSESGFKFIPPPEAPVFYPTPQEFEDPVLYLSKIKPIAFQTGICKIIPPKGWNPPFAVDINTFRFTPRVQRLYELEAHSRLKLDFISKLYQFVRLQGGGKLRIPSINGKYLDVFWLFKHVQKAGGFDQVTSAKLWPSIAEKLGYNGSKYATAIKSNYEKILLPFELVMCSKTDKKNVKRKESGVVSPTKRARTIVKDVSVIDYNANKELQNLKFFGAGPKAAVPINDTTPEIPKTSRRQQVASFACQICNLDNNEANLLICSTQSCQACYHTYCLSPPLPGVPRWQWKCPQCIREICGRPMELYGFPQAAEAYSLQEFGVKADSFKAQYFRQKPIDVPCSTVEQEFWRILQEYTEDVVVEYGADIHSSDQGSGFPTELQIRNCPEMYPTAEQKQQALMYAQSPWNLNNLPVFGNSVLRFIKGNIDGMKVPWCYVGMVFSTFCWHIEDHWSCSINFMHWGEPKTWYGVSSLHAEDFERAMRNQAAELFDLSPDLLHHITTIMNPNLIQAEGVPIYRTDQHCGEFVVTFPRAYHAGFNQGFNFAEAVNICCPDWLPIGRACIEHYASMKRQCVFSNDELLLTLAEVAAGIRPMEEAAMWTDLTAERFRSTKSTGFDINALSIIHDEFAAVLKREVAHRTRLAALRSERERLDELVDDERVCAVCQTTLFFSALICVCKASNNGQKAGRPARTAASKRKNSQNEATNQETPSASPSKMVCLAHADSVCGNCKLNDCTVKYTYTIEELEAVRAKLAKQLAGYDAWRTEFGQFLGVLSAPSADSRRHSIKSEPDSIKPGCSTTLNAFELKLAEAEKCGYHNDLLYRRAATYLKSLKDLVTICDQVVSFLDNKKPNGTEGDHSQASSIATFQLKRPATFTISSASSDSVNKAYLNVNHEVDLRNPREVDILRLLEAIDQQAPPVSLEDVASVKRLRRLTQCIQEWRVSAKETIAASRAFILPGPGVQLVLSDATKVKSEAPLECLQQQFSKLAQALRTEFPGWCDHMEDFAIMTLLEEVCAWLALSNQFGLPSRTHKEEVGSKKKSEERDTSESKSSVTWTVRSLREHLERGESLVSRIASADATSSLGTHLDPLLSSPPAHVRIVGSRLLRSLPTTNPDVADADGVSSKPPPPLPPTTTTKPAASQRLTSAVILASAHPLIRHIRARLHTAVGRLSQSLVDVDSLVAVLAEAVQTIHFAQPSVVSNKTACATYISQLQAMGVSSLGQPSFGFLLPDPSPALTRFTTSDDHNAAAGTNDVECTSVPPPLCCNPVVYESAVEALSNSSDESKLLYWWCAQAGGLIDHAPNVCPARPAAWLCDVSDLELVRRFIFGSAGSVPSTPGWPTAELALFQDAFRGFYRASLSSLLSFSLNLLPATEDDLVLDLYNRLLQALLPLTFKEESQIKLLAGVHSAALLRDFSSIEGLLNDIERGQESQFSSQLSPRNFHFCIECQQKFFGLVEPSDSQTATLFCPTCNFTACQISSGLDVNKLTELCAEEPQSSTVTHDLIQSAKICLRAKLKHYQEWLTSVSRTVAENWTVFSELGSVAAQLPAPIAQSLQKTRALSRAAAHATEETAELHIRRLLLLGSSFSTVFSEAAAPIQLLKDALVVLFSRGPMVSAAC